MGVLHTYSIIFDRTHVCRFKSSSRITVHTIVIVIVSVLSTMGESVPSSYKRNESPMARIITKIYTYHIYIPGILGLSYFWRVQKSKDPSIFVAIRK